MRVTLGATIARREILPLRLPLRENMIGTNMGYWDPDETLHPLDVAIGSIFPRVIHNPCTLYTF